MSEIKDGGPAFPSEVGHGMHFGSEGMSLRDYFAAKAMAALILKAEDFDVEADDGLEERAYLLADGMLSAREVKP